MIDATKKYDSAFEMMQIVKLWFEEETDVALQREFYMAACALESVATRLAETISGTERPFPDLAEGKTVATAERERSIRFLLHTLRHPLILVTVPDRERALSLCKQHNINGEDLLAAARSQALDT